MDRIPPSSLVRWIIFPTKRGTNFAGDPRNSGAEITVGQTSSDLNRDTKEVSTSGENSGTMIKKREGKEREKIERQGKKGREKGSWRNRGERRRRRRRVAAVVRDS